MDDATINKFLSSNLKTRDKFAGVFSCDTLPYKPEKKDCYYVINYDDSDEEGSHWISVHCCPNHKVEYFDSYGMYPGKKEFLNFMGKTFIYNNVQLQHNLTTVCGQWAIFFIWMRCKGKSMDEIVRIFKNSPLIVNDTMVNAAVENAFGTIQKVVDTAFLKKHMKSTQQFKARAKLYK